MLELFLLSLLADDTEEKCREDDDPYCARNYGDEYEFYEENRGEFYSFEDAEDYWNDHQ